MRWLFLDLLGLGDGHGRVSFNKLVTMVLLVVWLLVSVWCVKRLEQVPPWYVWSFGIILQGAGFGIKGYMAALETRKEVYNASATMEMRADLSELVKAVRDRRDPERGIDPA